MVAAVKTVVTIQARMTSTRLPGKVLMPAVGKPMLELMIERLKRVRSVDGIVVATTTNVHDDSVADLADRLDVGCHRGSEQDVMSRVLGAAEAFGADVIVQTTGDCPLIDPDTVESVVQEYRRSGRDYVSNVLKRTFPIGMDTQVFATAILRDAALRAMDAEDREHVSTYIYHHPELYSLGNVEASRALHDPSLRLTLDTSQDYELISKIFSALYPRKPDFSLADVMALLAVNTSWRAINGAVQHRWVKPIKRDGRAGSQA